MPDAKVCPRCGKDLRLYGVNAPMHPVHFATWVVDFCLGSILLVVLGVAFGEVGMYVAMVVAPAILILIFWRPWRRAEAENKEQYGRYYCESCHQHFEGAGLRQITQ